VQAGIGAVRTYISAFTAVFDVCLFVDALAAAGGQREGTLANAFGADLTLFALCSACAAVGRDGAQFHASRSAAGQGAGQMICCTDALLLTAGLFFAGFEFVAHISACTAIFLRNFNALSLTANRLERTEIFFTRIMACLYVIIVFNIRCTSKDSGA
jgi:hypothetical protein